jgi:predicted unusual protein kinase regulating ubiquinone biosynthesis (AarF/ABC1/UbiB family)
MNENRKDRRSMSIPSKRLVRLGHVGSMAVGIAGNMALNGVAQLGQGQRPVIKDLLLTPRNITRITNQLAKLRGAAMKIGQLISMDSGDLLPPELAQIMAPLRDSAYCMPPAQLKQVLNTQWPQGWLKEFKKFDVHPIAAASIGQVHRAQLKDGRDLAIKVQYPGVAESIDSDVANVGVLMRISGLFPKGFELTTYLDEARKQLHEETDYTAEAAHLCNVKALLNDMPRFVVPNLHKDWSTPSILAMDYISGIPIEDAALEPQEVRNKIAADLIELTLSELFKFGYMQTDPNFANYLYLQDTRQIVLLDFGATRRIDPVIIDQYRRFLYAGLADNPETLIIIAQEIGFVSAETRDDHRTHILRMIRLVFAVINDVSYIDFTNHKLPKQLQADGLALIEDGFTPPPLPIDILLLQRKFAGIFLLSSRLAATVDVAQIMQRYLCISNR